MGSNTLIARPKGDAGFAIALVTAFSGLACTGAESPP